MLVLTALPLTLDLYFDPLADGGWHAIGCDAEVSRHVGPLEVTQPQEGAMCLLSWDGWYLFWDMTIFWGGRSLLFVLSNHWCLYRCITYSCFLYVRTDHCTVDSDVLLILPPPPDRRDWGPPRAARQRDVSALHQTHVAARHVVLDARGDCGGWTWGGFWHGIVFYGASQKEVFVVTWDYCAYIN